jgi:hypothetical protein
MKRFAIVGAGAAGLAAAQVLTRRGFEVVLYEKSRGVGGRVTTRRVYDCIIDHGAQVVQAPSRELQRLVLTEPLDDMPGPNEIVRPVWTFDVAGTISEGDTAANSIPRWCWPRGSTTLSKTMAAGLMIRQQVRVQRLIATGQGYTLLDETGQVLDTADAVLLTPPAPQTAEIIAASSLARNMQRALLNELGKASYRRCLSVALAYPRRPDVPWYALVNLDHQHPVAWLGCEHEKTGHAPLHVGLMLAQMSHDFSVHHWDAIEKGTYEDEIRAHSLLIHIHAYVQQLAGTLGAPLWADVHRWRYALPASHADFDTLNRTGSGLYFAGDYVDEKGRVHQAIERGWQVAEVIAHDFTD